MQHLLQQLSCSARELKKVRSLTTAAMLLAVAVVLGIFSIPVTPSVKVSLATIAIQLTAALFGPAVAGISGGLADVIQHFIRPTGAYFPGFTISGILAGLIFGFFYYRRQPNLKRIIFANILVSIPVNLFLNTFWLKILYGSAYLALLPARAAKELILLPVFVVLVALLLRVAGGIKGQGAA